jgi:pimeloyl-ACP methyl ester carboxylesterase
MLLMVYWKAELVHVTVPTLVIAISEAPTNSASNSRHLAANLPRSTLVTIGGMGHALPRAIVPRLSAAILNHLEAVEAEAGR